MKLVRVVPEAVGVAVAGDFYIPLRLGWDMGGLSTQYRSRETRGVGIEINLRPGWDWAGTPASIAVIDPPPLSHTPLAVSEGADEIVGLPAFDIDAWEVNEDLHAKHNFFVVVGEHHTLVDETFVTFRFARTPVASWVTDGPVRFGFDSEFELVCMQTQWHAIPSESPLHELRSDGPSN